MVIIKTYFIGTHQGNTLSQYIVQVVYQTIKVEFQNHVKNLGYSINDSRNTG